MQRTTVNFFGGLIMLVVALAMTSGCSDGGAGGVTVGTSLLPREPVGFRLELTSTTSTVGTAKMQPQGAIATGAFTVTDAEANVGRIDLRTPSGIMCSDYHDAVTNLDASLLAGRCEAEDGGSEIRFDGPFRVDLLTGNAQPPLARLAVPAGLYRRVDVRIDNLEDESTSSDDDPLSERSIVIYGQLETTTVTPVRIDLEINRDIRFESGQDFEIGAQGGGDIAVRISTVNWFDGLAALLSDCLNDADTVLDGQTLVVSDIDPDGNECEGVAEQLETTIEEAGEFEREDDDVEEEFEEPEDDDDD